MIANKKDLRFYIAADRLMNGLSERRTVKEYFSYIFDRSIRSIIVEYLCAMRHVAYYKNTMKRRFSLKSLLFLIWHRRFNKFSLKLGFSIGVNSLGYGVVIPHNGTIVINEDARVGNFSVLHTCTCIAGGNKEIGDYFYLSTGSQLIGDLCIGEGVTVAAHSLVNKSCESHVLLVGAPATVKKKDAQLWPERDGKQLEERVKRVMRVMEKVYNN